MGVLDKLKQAAKTTGFVTKTMVSAAVKSLQEDLMGIKETKDVLTAVFRMLRVVRQVGSTGWKLDSAGLIITDQELMKTVAEAFTGADKIPSELNSLTFGETMELATYVLDGMQELTKPKPIGPSSIPQVTEKKPNQGTP